MENILFQLEVTGLQMSPEELGGLSLIKNTFSIFKTALLLPDEKPGRFSLPFSQVLSAERGVALFSAVSALNRPSGSYCLLLKKRQEASAYSQGLGGAGVCRKSSRLASARDSLGRYGWRSPVVLQQKLGYCLKQLFLGVGKEEQTERTNYIIWSRTGLQQRYMFSFMLQLHSGKQTSEFAIVGSPYIHPGKKRNLIFRSPL